MSWAHVVLVSVRQKSVRGRVVFAADCTATVQGVGASQFFRANVGIVVTDGAGRVLIFERAELPGQWNLPQGGLDEGEEPLECGLRELHEETGIGTDQVDIVGLHPRWIAYELPPDLRRKKIGRGQVQKWLCLRAIKPDGLVLDYRVHGRPEFRDHEWVSAVEAIARSVPFRRAVYADVFAHFASEIGPGPEADRAPSDA